MAVLQVLVFIHLLHPKLLVTSEIDARVMEVSMTQNANFDSYPGQPSTSIQSIMLSFILLSTKQEATLVHYTTTSIL